MTGHRHPPSSRHRHPPIRIHLRSAIRASATSPVARVADTLGQDHLRLLLGRLRHAGRRQGWQGRHRPRQSRPSRQPRQALPQGTQRTPHSRCSRPREAAAAAQRRQARSCLLGRSARHAWSRSSRAVQQKYGNDALGVIGTGQLVTEEFYTLGKLVQLGFRTPQLRRQHHAVHGRAVSGYKLSFGSDGPPGSYADMETADVILLIGANIADNHPILCQRLERNRKQSTHPHRRRSARHQDRHDGRHPSPHQAAQRYRPAQRHRSLLIREGLIDRDYIEQHTTGFEEFAAFVCSFTPQHVAEVTGLSEETIVNTAYLYGNAKAAFIGWTMGVNHSTQGAATVTAINNLALITGNIGRAGAAPFSITGQCNAMGTRESGFTSSLPGYRKFDNPQDREDLARIWNIDVDRIPTARGLAYPDIIEAAVAGKIKALWFIATNPAVSFPNYSVLEQALRSVDFLVVQDGFHPTPTSEFAHLVLPAAIWGEKEGTYTNSERRVSKVNRCRHAARRSSSRLRYLPRPCRTPRRARRTLSGLAHDARRLQRVAARLRGPHVRLQQLHLAADRRCKAACSGAASGSTPTASSLRLSGKAVLYNVPCLPFVEQPNAEYNLILNTGRTVEHWHTRTKTAEVEMLDNMVPNAWLEMNPIDAARLELQSSRSRQRRLAPQHGEKPRAADHRHRRSGTGLHALSLLRDQLQPRHPRSLRSHLARTQLQAVRRSRREVLAD